MFESVVDGSVDEMLSGRRKRTGGERICFPPCFGFRRVICLVYGGPCGFVRNKPCVRIDRAYCTGCATCVSVCPLKRVITMARDERGAYAQAADPRLCAGCGKCMFSCPTHAIGIRLV